MYFLADVNSCYSSCEKSFDPSIRSKVVLVLSNNDGTVVAACNIAKKVGLGKKFIPYFEVKEALESVGGIARSSNYALYGDLSRRMMTTLAQFAPHTFPYSIDEAFLYFDGYAPPGESWWEYARRIRRTIWTEVRLPIGVGGGSTPTLAKAANHAAKRIDGYRGLCVIENDVQRKSILRQMLVTDVWGIGNRIGKRLNEMGIYDALTLSEQDPKRIQRKFSITVADTVQELSGVVRLSWDEVRKPKKEIYSTRSFGKRILDAETLRQALCSHAEIAASKLRRQGSVAGGLMLFATNSPHDREPFFKRSLYCELTIPSFDTRIFNKAISESIDKLFEKGVRYYRCGVGLLDISDSEKQQYDLFDTSKDNKALMACMDVINQRYGRGTTHFAAKGFDHKFEMRRQFLSPEYTTRWSDIPKIKCD
jgi:DNA polymerase V